MFLSSWFSYKVFYNVKVKYNERIQFIQKKYTLTLKEVMQLLNVHTTLHVLKKYVQMWYTLRTIHLLSDIFL